MEQKKAFRILVVGSPKWLNAATVEGALGRHVVHHAVGCIRAVTVACGNQETGVDRICRMTTTRMQKNLPGVSLEIREEGSLEYPVGFDVVLGFPIDPVDWEILKRANLLGVEVQIFPESSR